MVLDADEREFLDGVLKEAGDRRSPLLYLLHRIQAEWGMIPQEAAEYLSRNLSIPMARIFSAVTFYESFTLSPRGSIVISVCRGIVCHSKGSDRLLRSLEDRIGIREGETSEDGLITLRGSSCIGQCDGAPAVMVNDKVIREADLSKLMDLIGSLKEGGDHGGQ